MAQLEIIAHRGGSLEAPENTCAAITHAVAAGSRWQEVDVGLSADGEAVVVHDDSLDRTGHRAQRVAQLSAAELAACNVGQPAASAEQLAERAAWQVLTPPWPSPPAMCPVPTLSEVLAVPGSRLMIELKQGPQPERLVAQVARALAEAGRNLGASTAQRATDGPDLGPSDCVVGSFSTELLQLAAKMMPTVPQVGIAANLAEARRWLSRPLWAIAVHTSVAPHLRPLWGLRLWAWTVCCQRQATELAAAGADGLITDVPAALISAGVGRKAAAFP